MHTHLQGKFPLVGIAAKAQSGKTTMANHMMARCGYQHHISFAEPIRQFISDLTGISRADLETAEIKEAVIPWIGRSPRYMMQTLGTEWGRDCLLKDFWIKRALMEVERKGTERCVISDVRFDNEAEAIRAAGGVVVHLVRPDALVVASHPSEAGVTRAPEDFLIVNDGSLDAFKRDIGRLFYGLWKGEPSLTLAFRK